MTHPTPLATHLTLEEAVERLLEAAVPVTELQSLPVQDALGRVLGRPLLSTLDVPPLANAAMDGYAVRSADLPAPGTLLPVSQRIPAGSVGRALKPGTAARIFTGAPLPEGADAVVMQEVCEAEGESVRLMEVPPAGQWVRPRGEDVRAGQIVLARGTRLGPQALGLAATVGATHLDVVRRPRVALFSTGDELVMPGEPLRPGAIYNSNRTTLRALLMQVGCEVLDLGIVPDRLEATRVALRTAAAENDLILTSGGVSTGEEDHIRAAVTSEGELHAWLLNTKPGRPLAFGRVRRPEGGAALFLGLPGNPVSSFYGFLLLVRPLLLALQGVAYVPPSGQWLRAESDWPRGDRRREFLRARRDGQGGVSLFQNQSSGVLTSAVWADGFIDNPPGRSFQVGDTVRFLSFAELMA